MYKMTQARDASEGRRWKSTRCDVPIKERKNPFLVSMPGPILVYKTPMKNFCRKERSLRVDAREKTLENAGREPKDVGVLGCWKKRRDEKRALIIKRR
jgi:hypothetical protein